MKNRRGISGFTMAEMLIVVAIIAVLGGVGFVAVQNYQHGMAMVERDTVAKEIFIAAQNHLTMADSQGYMGLGADSIAMSELEADKPNIHIIKNFDNTDTDTIKMFELMLPFGSIDETVRAGGRYYIRYQTNPARVLDVFYWTVGDRFAGKGIVYSADLLELGEKSKAEDRKKKNLGWYGGMPAVSTGVYTLKAPTIRVINEEKLIVEVTDENTEENPSIKLIVSSKDAHPETNKPAKVAFELTANLPHHRVSSTDERIYEIVLDSVIEENDGESFHFVDLNDISDRQGTFIPGEDIVVQAVAYSNEKLINIAYSAEITVNSLFADLVDVPIESTVDPDSEITGGESPAHSALFAPDGTQVEPGISIDTETPAKKSAVITHFRHLENLDTDISSVDHKTLDITQAKQVADLDWSSYSEEKIYYKDEDTYVNLDAGCYKPVNVDYLSRYDGEYTESEKSLSHSITGIKVDYTGNSGLFGTFDYEPEDGAEPAKITNLELVNFEIKSNTGHAGALAGTLNNTTVSNVLAYHNNDSEQTTITANDGDAGGLVGDMNGGQIEQCAAALYVHAGANAGGLVGKAENADITASYSGGHTKEGSYSDNTEADDAAESGLVNVIGGTNAGGLIGAATGTTSIQYCYSTCSTYAKISGGLIGSANEVAVAENYAAGLVLATTEEGASRGMFLGAGNLTLGSIEGKTVSNYYVSGINGTLGSGAESVVKVFEMSKVTDNATTAPYDATLAGKPYSYLTVAQLSGKTTDESEPEHLKIHYGDWQEPVTLETGLALINAEKLTAKVSLPVADLGAGQMLTMMVKGKTSKEAAYLVMSLDKNTTDGKTTYDVALKATSSIEDIAEITGWLDNIIVKTAGMTTSFEFGINLDSITDEGCHFAQLFPTFIPGEDITVAIRGNEVSSTEMGEIIKHEPDTDKLVKKTNSLFADLPHKEGEADIDGTEVDKKKAAIGNFRHLENLDKTISGLGGDGTEVTIDTAVQLHDMDWMTDWSGGWKDATIYLLSDGKTLGDSEHFIPVDLNYPLDYQGNSKAISNLVVNHTGHAGLFGSMNGGSVSDLELIDFSVTGTGDAGTLAGKLTNTEVINVISYHNSKATSSVTTTSGDAGGLIGSMVSGSVNKSAAAVIVSAGDDTHVGNAGGLIGAVSDGTIVNASYSGGHTVKGAYTTAYNVTATGTAGGLIGVAGNANISNSYSTCSAKGATVGGFVGTAEGTIQNCYATGLVSGSTDTSTKGAFAGELSKATNCWVYEIINEGMDAIGNKPAASFITDIDESTASYNEFVGDPDAWNPANPYDPTLGTLFENSYNLQTVDQLAKGTKAATSDEDIAANFAYTHYGDWPAPEMLVINK